MRILKKMPTSTAYLAPTGGTVTWKRYDESCARAMSDYVSVV